MHQMVYHIKDYVGNLSNFESVDYEYKVKLDTKNPRGWAKTVVAFANKNGGNLYIGVADNGTAVGFSEAEIDQVQRYFVDFVKNRITPLIDYEINYITLDNNKRVIYIEIKEFKGDVVKYINKEKDTEEVYIRKPRSTYLANFDESMRLYLRKSHVPYDARMTENNIDNYTIEALNEKYKEMNDTLDTISTKQLINTRMIDDNGFLSIAGMLFVDKREERFPLIHMRKWPGFNKGDDVVIDRKEFRGNIIEQLNMALLFVKNNSKTGFVKLPNGRRDIEAYPERTVIEALCNALGHRDYTVPGTQIDVDIYQDRMVIMSPGDFLPEGNAQDYKAIDGIPSKRRNEVICDILALCKLMERSGSGFEKIKEAYRVFDERFQPKVISNLGTFSITLMDLTYHQKYKDIVNSEMDNVPLNGALNSVLNGALLELYNMIKNNPGINRKSLAEKMGKAKTTLDRQLKVLINRNLIERVGSRKTGGYVAIE